MGPGTKGVSGTKEWASTNANVMKGCANGCLYCYACANAVRFGQKKPLEWTTEEVNEKALTKGFGKRQGTIMFPTTHDLNMKNLRYTLPFLRRMLDAGNKVLVVSKPWMQVIQKVCDECAEHKNQILFRFTIGSGIDETLSFWEPFAPPWISRLSSLYFAYERGFQTSVSMEPLLETDENITMATIDALLDGVTDSLWVGKMNKVQERLKRNGHWESPGVQEKARELVLSQSDERIRALYERVNNSFCGEKLEKIRWKESIKKVVGLPLVTEAGLDI